MLVAILVLAHCSMLSVPATARSFGRTVIVDSAFTVRAGDARYWEFSVSKNGANVSGRFRAEGGGGNDIICLILDRDSFENWRNGHTVNTYYNSGKITVANINVNLGEGNYVLVFSNTFSSVSNKAVTARVEMQR
jgi:hypothetical protein